MSDAPVTPRLSNDTCSLIGGAIAGIVLTGIMLATMCMSGHSDKLPHMWFLGLVFGLLAGLFCLEHFSLRSAAIVAPLTAVPFVLCSIVVFACSFIF